MSYVRKVIAKDEELIGIARLHWIYIIKGLAWFIVMAAGGWLADSLITRGLMYVGGATNNYAVPAAFMTISNAMMMFMIVGGFFVFFLFVLKVLVTEVGLSNRRVIEKTGLLFVKVKQIDLEEIRGENMDMGHLGRILGYAYIHLDCRFIGDVKLPAIENPERFIKALHTQRARSQDALSVVVGKGNPVPVEDAKPAQPDGHGSAQIEVAQSQQQPDIQPSQPDIQPSPAQPEIVPPGPAGPEIRPEPVPHAPPAQPMPPPQEQPAQPVPQQPIPNPGPDPQPPLQPPDNPTGAQAAVAPLDPQTVAQVVQQVTPQIAQQVVKEMTEQGLLKKEVPPPANDVDNLVSSFDDALTKKGARGNDPDNKMEYALH